jgi:tRNA(Leu) C34 or U34 (ribose-2'-O)-methylase TrmL
MRYAPRLHVVLHAPEIPPSAGNVGRTRMAIAPHEAILQWGGTV